MVSPVILEYVRSFLSPLYVDNLDPPPWFMKIRRQSADTDVIRLRDHQAFEK
jgi:hypothetical protein